MPEHQPHPRYLELMDKAESALDEAHELASQGSMMGEAADRMMKVAECYRDFSAMFRGQGF